MELEKNIEHHNSIISERETRFVPSPIPPPRLTGSTFRSPSALSSKFKPLSSVTSISTDVYSKIRGQLSTQSKIGATQYGNDSEAA